MEADYLFEEALKSCIIHDLRFGSTCHRGWNSSGILVEFLHRLFRFTRGRAAAKHLSQVKQRGHYLYSHHAAFY